jgi:hypothetical protein
LLFIGPAVFRSPAASPTQYTTDGVPTGLEEEIRWKVNRGRFDTAGENQQRGTAYSDVPATAGPLAPNQSLTLAARHHSEDMAKHNVFQHETIPGSAYYNATTQPEPWDRMTAEGYSWNYAAENIAAGYVGSEAAYVGWWNSSGHRANMYNGNLREIGDGYYYYASSTYKYYYTMDLGTSGSSCFFTDTLFRDANSNGIYDQAEAVAGVTVTLLVNGIPAGYYDVSSSVGSFAVPIQAIAANATVQVVLSNTTAAAVTLSIPRDYRTFTTVTLAASASQVAGSFAKSSGRNYGFRNLAPLQSPAVSSKLLVLASGTNISLQWPSQTGQTYMPQRSTNLTAWSNMATNYLSGTGSNLSVLDPMSGGPRKFYRLVIQRP